ncbi:MAG TPA: cupin domain-containing protein [Patescibacteria group bacterium]
MAQPTSIDDIPQQLGASNNFTGTVYIQPLVTAENGPTTVSRVTFEKGAHTFWHTHGGEQVLYFLEGKGRVEIEGQGVIDANPGDIVRIPPNTRHWHGAHPEEPTRMRHIAITSNGVTWLEEVSNEVYKAG